MPKDGTRTREKILDSSQALILNYGYGGTSIDMVIDKAGITKGAFFYHFKSKAELAKALVERFARYDSALLNGSMERAEKLSRDPLQQLLIFLGLINEMMEGLNDPYTCLFASYAYQAEMFDDDIKKTINDTIAAWREKISTKLHLIAKQHPPSMEVDLDSLADLLTTVLEGSFVLSKTYNDAGVISRQFRHYINYLELLFVHEKH